MGLRIAAGIWFIFTLLMTAGFFNQLSERKPGGVVLGAALMVATAWLGYRLLRRPTRDIALIAACVAGFLVLLMVVSMLQGGLSLAPVGGAALILAVLGGLLPLWWRRNPGPARQP